jgi:hypothetical protein
MPFQLEPRLPEIDISRFRIRGITAQYETMSGGMLCLRITFVVGNLEDHGEHSQGISTYIPGHLAAQMSRADLDEYAYNAIIECLRHEVHETLRFDGKRYRDPHPPGRNPVEIALPRPLVDRPRLKR